MAELSKRAKTCEGLMMQGAYWRRQLETHYKGGEKFTYRLKSFNGHIIPGFSFQTWNELEAAGKLAHKECSSSSVWPTEWALKVEEMA